MLLTRSLLILSVLFPIAARAEELVTPITCEEIAFSDEDLATLCILDNGEELLITDQTALVMRPRLTPDVRVPRQTPTQSFGEIVRQ